MDPSGPSRPGRRSGWFGAGREVYALEGPRNGAYQFAHAASWLKGRHALAAWRQTEPLKSLFFPAREFIGRWDGGEPRKPLPERIVFGVKNCDLSWLAVFDHVFLHGVVPDPYYAEARAKTTLVASDCTGHLEVCFCPAVGEQPWAKRGIDINIAETAAGCVIEDGSARGAQLLRAVEPLLAPAGDGLLAALASRRAEHYPGGPERARMPISARRRTTAIANALWMMNTPTRSASQLVKSTVRENARARAYYERSGWRADGTEKDDGGFTGPVVHEVRYRRALA